MGLAKANGVHLEVVPVEMAFRAEKIFMCTTAGGVMPITTLDRQRVNGGKVGPITKLIWNAYWDMHYKAAYSFEVAYEA